MHNSHTCQYIEGSNKHEYMNIFMGLSPNLLLGRSSRSMCSYNQAVLIPWICLQQIEVIYTCNLDWAGVLIRESVYWDLQGTSWSHVMVIYPLFSLGHHLSVTCMNNSFLCWCIYVYIIMTLAAKGLRILSEKSDHIFNSFLN